MTNRELLTIVGRNVLARRTELKMSQRDLALKSECSQGRISQLESLADPDFESDREENLTTDLIVKLARGLRCAPSSLLSQEFLTTT